MRTVKLSRVPWSTVLIFRFLVLCACIRVRLCVSISLTQNDTVNTPKTQPLVQQQPLNTFPVCKDFENSTNNEFSSPIYPGHYPDGVDCFKIITAGEGEVIRLRFVDHFHLEPDNDDCKYDYLEIRDGQYGYSTIIGKLCGSSPPTYLESSGKHLWLRFHSDQDINHVGFKAVYEFVSSSLARPDLEDCSFTMIDLDSNIRSEDLSPEILTNRKDLSIPYLDCTWVIEAPEKQKIYLQFKEFNLEKANDCTFNFVEVYGSRTELDGDEGRRHQFCGSDTKPIASKSNIFHLRFFTALSIDDSELGVGFKTKLVAYYSFFREISKVDPKAEEPEKCREPEEFDCTDNTCVDKALVCNGEPNCKLRNDEDKSRCNTKQAAFEMTMDLIVIAFIGCFLATGMCSGLILQICRKLRQDKIELEEIRANLRKSRDSMGHLPSSSSKLASRDNLKSIEIAELNNHNPPELHVVPEQKSGSTPPPGGVVPSSSPENSSGESKETVIYRPYYKEELPLGFVLKHTTASSPTPPPLQSSESTSIPYSPPPPYNPKYKQTPKLSKKVGQEEEEEPEEVHVIEVRDCGCQTKESFTEKYLREVYFGPHHYYPPRMSQSPSYPGKRAPLARTEALEVFDLNAPPRRHVRRIPKSSADVLMYPKSPSSIASSVDASTGSLELLSELDEEEETVVGRNSSKPKSGYRELE